MFTDRYIRNLRPEGKIKDIGEKNGFGVRVKIDGTKVFFYRYNSPVTIARRFIVLGEYPEVSLESARIKYYTAYKAVKAGIDPLEVALNAQAERKAASTIKELVADYLKRHAEVNKKSWLEDKRILEKEVLPVWQHRKAEDIRKRDIITLLDKIVDRGAPGIANNTFKIIRAMFNWSVKKDILQISPCTGIDMPAPLNVRDRALTADEVKTVWAALEDPATSMICEIRQALKLILVTAQRPGEVIGLHTNEIDGDWWLIPAERSKNGKAHRVFLTPLAKSIIDITIAQVKRIREIPAETEYKGFVFPCPHKAKDKSIQRHALKQDWLIPMIQRGMFRRRSCRT
ncbi:MAG: integrase family protein [Desulfobacteraceae bacterium]|nr:integrase family protein [Desulfobacteraceae bacterium]